MPNMIEPYTPVQFSQVTPMVIFNLLNKSISACHQPITYFEGVSNSELVYLH
jgi:hypothetical protein